ncbi:CPBP family intramembrane metalloprotease [Brevibacillus laterosporus]|uniref:CAAX protease self-immunity protein n=1 Tax=Brevibacillus laterosporus LMG 15441 TaxID=1042163 RepID=A0A075RA80_BRELA|nr:CPBP family intramembrane glutamic endopeptidase [Brevibacillus laterosporus]AIG26465.1 CAAX protease self-immunity protein [Brevibacillus laterosporus LMG 15441]ERM18110.1 CAAX amino terminal protease [Brevibacillus laterosporus PE36]RJL07625.1 CPBP family intramembrane metalloprotease [Brevibacillus laterosporus]TPH13665.1 CPBP family intramembrane metalloprotease [Brevibacillus laterosporus]
MKDKTKKTKKDFNPKDAVFVFSSFTFICVAIIFILIVYDVLTIHNFLSFEKPIRMIMHICSASFALLLYGVILTLYIPSKYIDDTNKSYQNYSLLPIFVFMLLGALFEELLFRGIIQNLLFIFIENQWIAIIATTLFFLGFHTQYFKKPIMLINISIPSFTFGWLYFETNNILVPFVVHFLMNLGITLLFKYNLIRVKK